MPKREVRVGQAYIPNSASFMGNRNLVWSVTALYTGTDGLLYAKLVNALDSSLTKTLGVDALTDPRRFTLHAE